MIKRLYFCFLFLIFVNGFRVCPSRAKTYDVDLSGVSVSGGSLSGFGRVNVKGLGLNDVDGLLNVVLDIQELQSSVSELQGSQGQVSGLLESQQSLSAALDSKVESRVVNALKTDTEGSILSLTQQLESQATTNSEQEATLEAMNERLSGMADEQSRQETSINDLSLKLDGYGVSQDDLTQTVSDHEERLSAQAEALTQTQQALNDTRRDFSQTAQDLKLASETNAVAIEQNKAAIAAQTQGLEEAQQEIAEHRTLIEAQGQAIGDVNFEGSRYLKGRTDLSSAFRTLDQEVSRLEQDLGKLEKEVRGGFASMAAMSGLVPNARDKNDTQISVGSGIYQGETGFAVGAFHYVNDNLLLNAGVAYGGNSSAMAKVGVTFGW